MEAQIISPLSYLVVIIFTLLAAAYLFSIDTDDEFEEIFEYEEELLKQPRKGGNGNAKK